MTSLYPQTPTQTNISTSYLTEIVRCGDSYQARYEIPAIDVVKFVHPVYTNVASMTSKQSTSRTLKNVSRHAVHSTQVEVQDISETAARELSAWVKDTRDYTVEGERDNWIIRVGELVN